MCVRNGVFESPLSEEQFISPVILIYQKVDIEMDYLMVIIYLLRCVLALHSKRLTQFFFQENLDILLQDNGTALSVFQLIPSRSSFKMFLFVHDHKTMGNIIVFIY